MISVIIPMYNNESTICKVLNSVKFQSAFYLIKEIIIIDDGSSDNSCNIVEKYIFNNAQMNIKLIKKDNGGASSARNIGLRLAKGKYIALLDADDIWLPMKIEKQMEILIQNSEIVFLGSNYKGGKLRIPFKKIKKLHRANAKEICWCNFPVTPSVIFKREVIDYVGYFDENQKYGEDINYYQKIGAKYNYFYLDEELVDIGINKNYFAQSGLTSNLKMMHKGTIKNIYDMYKTKEISLIFYCLMRVFYQIKYARRLVISKTQKNKIMR